VIHRRRPQDAAPPAQRPDPIGAGRPTELPAYSWGGSGGPDASAWKARSGRRRKPHPPGERRHAGSVGRERSQRRLPAPTPHQPPRDPHPAPRGERGGCSLQREARKLVQEAQERLWSPKGLRYRRWLHLQGLTNATIRAAGLGWTPDWIIPTRGDIRYYRAGGFVIPWFDGDRLAMVKIRQPASRRPKYVEAFRDAPGVYPSPAAVRPGAPLILVKHEFDALLLSQELGDLAAVVTVGSASASYDGLARRLYRAERIFAAHDAGPAGDRAAATWPERVIRVRPPSPGKDWTEAARSGVNLRQWWGDRLDGIDPTDRLEPAEDDRAERAGNMSQCAL
jgi:hypothetical protein